MRLVDMTDDQLLEQMGKIGEFDEDLNKVWDERHDMYIPYYLEGRAGEDLNIINALTDTLVPDEMCDKMILEQAEALRKERRDISLPMPYHWGTLQDKHETPVVYQHYKGNLYQYLGTANDSDTLDNLIVYQDMNKGWVWTRHEDDFHEWTINKHSGKKVKRFKFVEPERIGYHNNALSKIKENERIGRGDWT